MLRMTNSWYGQEDVGLTAKLLEELPSILLWAIRGWERLHKRGKFIQPGNSRDMEDLSSPMGAFVRENCVLGAEMIPVKELYDRWKEWCAEKGRKSAGTEQTFGRDLRTASRRWCIST